VGCLRSVDCIQGRGFAAKFRGRPSGRAYIHYRNVTKVRVFIDGEQELRSLPGIALAMLLLVATLAVPMLPEQAAAQELDEATAQVVGGRDAGDHEFPYLAAVFLNGFQGCGGSLIAANWVVSSAHCFVDESTDSILVGLGSANLQDGLQLFTVANVVIHPDFDRESSTGATNDIALLQLSTFVDLADPTIGLIALPVEPQPENVSSVLLVSGWGDVDPSTTFEFAVVARVAEVQESGCGPFDNHWLCTSDADGDGGCSGDSGGPLVEASGRVHTLLAVVEATSNPAPGDTVCGRNTTVIHQRVAPHIEWMRSVTGEPFRTCGGFAVTAQVVPGVPFFGTDANDVVFGSPANDEIHGGGGDDAICAEAGDDRILAGAGDDFVDGASGRDFIFGGSGKDVLMGGPDIDRMWGDAGRDILHGGGGSDRLRGGVGNDTVHAGSGADRVWGGPGNDTLNGMGGQDFMWGEAGNDTMQGNHQSDWLYGGPGDDDIFAAGGKDKLFGDGGNDQLFGGPNTDYLDGGPGDDVTHGGRGRDNPAIVDVSGCIGETPISC